MNVVFAIGIDSLSWKEHTSAMQHCFIWAGRSNSGQIVLQKILEKKVPGIVKSWVIEPSKLFSCSKQHTISDSCPQHLHEMNKDTFFFFFFKSWKEVFESTSIHRISGLTDTKNISREEELKSNKCVYLRSIQDSRLSSPQLMDNGIRFHKRPAPALSRGGPMAWVPEKVGLAEDHRHVFAVLFSGQRRSHLSPFVLGVTLLE